MLHIIGKNTQHYPAILMDRLQDDAPESLSAIGNLELLHLPKLAIFCSIKCPGRNILQAVDFVRGLCDNAKAVTGGFHSPVEKECLRILLQGSQPIIIVIARSLEKIRLPSDWKDAMEKGSLLLLSRFSDGLRRITADLAYQRNLLAAAMADEVCFIYADPGGRIDELRNRVLQWNIRITKT